MKAVLLLTALSAVAMAVTPFQKVKHLLYQLRAKVKAEGVTEAATYDKYACFARETIDARSQAIKDGRAEINLQSATIEQAAADIAADEAQIKQSLGDIARLTREMAEAEAQRAKELELYEEENADLTKAISSLEGAIAQLSGAKSSMSLVQYQLSADVRHAAAMADALGFLSARKATQVRALMQVDTSVDSSDDSDASLPDADYVFQSDDIVSVLESLRSDFVGRKGDVDGEEVKAVNAHGNLMGAKSIEKGDAETLMRNTQNDLDTAKETKGDAQEALIDAHLKLVDDERYLKDLSSKAELKAREWDQRSSLRDAEYKALTKALSLIRRKARRADSVNVRAFLQGAGEGDRQHAQLRTPGKHFAAKPALVSSEFAVSDGDVSSYDLTGAAFVQLRASSVARAIATLQKDAEAQSSTQLAQFVVQVQESPFKKVKGLIQKLIERLLSESKAEATKKGWCDTEIANATSERDFKHQTLQALNAKVSGLEAHRDQLSARVGELKTEQTELGQSLTNTADIRSEEKRNNLQTLKDAKAGLLAVKEAITILKNFYKGEFGVGGADTATVSLVDTTNGMPTEDDTGGPRTDDDTSDTGGPRTDDDTSDTGGPPLVHSGAYQGRQSAAHNIIGLLQVIASDYDRTVRKTRQAEAAAAAEYVEFDRTGKSSMSSKGKEDELKSLDHDQAVAAIAAGKREMSQLQELVDLSIQKLEELHPTCVDTGMSYEERVAAREAEVVALNRALCILDGEGVEARCT